MLQRRYVPVTEFAVQKVAYFIVLLFAQTSAYDSTKQMYYFVLLLPLHTAY